MGFVRGNFLLSAHCSQSETVHGTDASPPFYASFWRTVLFKGKMFEEVVQVTGSLLEYTPDSGSLLFDHAYGLEKIGKPSEAEATYKKLIELEPSNPNAMHNLSVLLEERDLLEEALELSSRAARLAPGDELITRCASHLEDKMKLHLRELQRRQEFLNAWCEL